ncbi:MAG TPA: flagellar protein FlgN [Candidatus Sumerlaeota bacterium]|nr:flagellar protein FlgN [Candidatus Sumerlaeota bacterium]HPK03028.1 flagellar protein FlgN [Candidatus Sumerlaeota bacterium]
MSEQPYESLLTLLGEERAIYEEMADLLDQEREAMLAMAVDRLAEIVARKETLALRIKALDESRRVLARRLGAALGLPPHELTISELYAAAPAEIAGRLRAVGAALREVVVRCREINQFNERAARRGLELVGGAIQTLLEQADPTGKVYEAPRPRARGYGGPVAPGGGGIFSRQA